MKLSDDARRLLDAANIAHLSTLQDDGAPKVAPVWLARAGDHVLVTADGSENLTRDAFSSL